MTPLDKRLAHGGFDRKLRPEPVDYFACEGLALKGRGKWRDALCVFHDDARPSLRINIETGAFKCMSCGAHGSDVIAFHMQRFGLRFVDAAKQLNAWEPAR